MSPDEFDRAIAEVESWRMLADRANADRDALRAELDQLKGVLGTAAIEQTVAEEEIRTLHQRLALLVKAAQRLCNDHLFSPDLLPDILENDIDRLRLALLDAKG